MVIKIKKSIKIIFLLYVMYLFSGNVLISLILWGILELIIYSIRMKNYKIITEFICNFVQTMLSCNDILINIVLQIPANRILLTTTKDSKYIFGDPKYSFTTILYMNFLYLNLKPMGIMLYNFIKKFRKF